MTSFARSFAVLVLLICPFLAGARTSSSTDALLREADRIRTQDPDQFNQLVDRLDQSVSSATPRQRQYLQLLHAYRFIKSGNYRSSIDTLDALLAHAPGFELQFRANSLLATNYAAMRDFTKAFGALDRMLAVREKLDDRDLRQHGLLNAAMLYNQAGKHDLARHYAELVLGDAPNDRNRCFAGQFLAEAMLGARQLPTEDAFLLDALRVCEAMNEKIATAFARGYLAQKWHHDGRTHEAIALLERHRKETLATRYPRLIAEIDSLLAQYHLEIGNTARAEEYANGALSNSTGSPTPCPW